MKTVIVGNKVTESTEAQVRGGELWMTSAEFERVVGGKPADAADINVSATWRQLGRPVICDSSEDAWVLGASARERNDALNTLQAPDFTLADLDGNVHSLSDYRGKKVFLATWASW